MISVTTITPTSLPLPSTIRATTSGGAGTRDLALDSLRDAETFEHGGKVIASRHVAEDECVRLQQGLPLRQSPSCG
jgi:hypothetical protein